MEQYTLPFTYDNEEEDAFYVLTREGFNPKEYNGGKQINCTDTKGNVISYYPTTGTIVANYKGKYGEKKTYYDKPVDFYIDILRR